MNNLHYANALFGDIFGFEPFPSSTWYTYREVEVPTVKAVNMPAVKSVIFNKNATIVYFTDGTRSIVKKSPNDEYNREHAVVYAIVKRAYGIVGNDGIVEGNGMGNMLAKAVANGYDQEAHEAEEKAKRAAKRSAKRANDVDDETYDKCACPEKEVVKPWPTHSKSTRDSKGRFVKKANR